MPSWPAMPLDRIDADQPHFCVWIFLVSAFGVDRLDAAAELCRWGVAVNPFGEFLCVYFR